MSWMLYFYEGFQVQGCRAYSYFIRRSPLSNGLHEFCAGKILSHMLLANLTHSSKFFGEDSNLCLFYSARSMLTPMLILQFHAYPWMTGIHLKLRSSILKCFLAWYVIISKMYQVMVNML